MSGTIPPGGQTNPHLNPLDDPTVGPVNPIVIDPTIPLTDHEHFMRGDTVPTPADYPVIHPNTVVAVVTGRIVNEVINEDTRINPHLHTVLTGANARFAPVLDALASLAVADVKGQVVAIAVELLDEDTFYLRVAENGEVAPDLEKHVKWLMKRLALIANSSGTQRAADQRAFYRASCIYARTKLLKRFSTRAWLAKFEALLEDEKGEDALKCQNVLSALLTALEALEKLKEADKANKAMGAAEAVAEANLLNAVSDDEWDTVMFMMSTSIPYVQHLLEHPMVCEAWAETHKAVLSAKGGPVPLFRAIEKLTSHHRHILHLFDYAASVAGKADLGKQFKLNKRTIAPTSPTLTLPTPSVISSTIAAFLPTGTDLTKEVSRIKASIEAQFGHLKLTLTDVAITLPGVAHCECSLIAQLSQETGVRPPVTYVGVSKLSCAACDAWIKAFNATHAAQYHTRGCHARWYQGWAMPLAPVVMSPIEERVDQVMQHMMCWVVGRTYRRFVDAGLDVRKVALSDSTQAKTEFPVDRWSNPELTRLHALSVQKRLLRVPKKVDPKVDPKVGPKVDPKVGPKVQPKK